ncbi:MAG: hypothetical protein HPY55_11175 [Firmicutes bacterium]|nr:hypothetical protein [Bacillota bacterium]
MSQSLDPPLPESLVHLIKTKTATCTLATVGEDGRPNTAPIHIVTAPNERTLLMGIGRIHDTLRNIRMNPWVSASFMGEGDVAFSVKGRATITADRMASSEALAMVAIEVTEVKSDTAPSVLVEQGVKIRYRSDRAAAFVTNAFRELEQKP